MSAAPYILLAAGGTGGHVFPALSLAEELRAKEFDVRFVTDQRGRRYFDDLHTEHVHILPAATVYGGGVIKLPWRMVKLVLGIFVAFVILLRARPRAVVGFGGYPSFAPCLVARLLAVPVLVHEQNAVFGRANRLLARLGAYVATSFSDTALLPRSARRRTRRTGNPIRPLVRAEMQGGYRFLSLSRPFDLLIFGGSQGASIFNRVVPQAIAMLSVEERRRLRVTHQAQKNDMTTLLQAYNAADVYAEIRDFFTDMPRRIRRAHLVISRAGASTVSELSAIGAPSILVPLPGSLDADQLHNTRDLVGHGGAWVMQQKAFVPARLAAYLSHLMANPDKLRVAAQAARSCGTHDAVAKLGRYVLCLANRQPVEIEAHASASRIAQ
jgi:UDP-N-acetylglucosamine--N-acetylmuramyl-(pentapeptide) pyrophosphoryl-undecaprenol N-acetylglucosamine transferase